MSSNSKLFKPVKVGNVELQHRVVLAPLTRYKSDAAHVPYIPLVSDYYAQRASKPGTLLITEATYVAARAGGFPNIPGIWSPAQIQAWKAVTDAVHAKGSFIFIQLWGLGRAADPEQLKSEDPSFAFVSASDVPLKGHVGTPRPLTVPEIKEYVALWAQAAKNAIEAGFDGVEVHRIIRTGANGYLLDQFLQDMSNKRTDEYGGSVENRAQMGMTDPLPTFLYVVSQVAARHTDLAYLHLVEPRINGNVNREEVLGAHETNEPLHALWAPRPLIRAGAFTRESALEAAESGDLIAFGRLYISNPDLPARLERDIPLNDYDRTTFYLIGENTPRGYTDQPFATVTVAA
ncbi:hypothetical protein C8R46DRAFT_1296905 [Mycena filopes]|nr:hypothetical protein C8R46DRAFT_1296905 [Mycena filopes]